MTHSVPTRASRHPGGQVSIDETQQTSVGSRPLNSQSDVPFEQSATQSDTASSPLLPEPRWLPVTLRWQYLCAMVAFTILILITVLSLHLASQHNSGLGDDHQNSGVYVLTNFLPTIVAVSYVFMISAILDDVQRTEPYARAASAQGAPALNTLFFSMGPWWSAITESLPKKKSSRRFSPAMFCATIAFILGFLLLSPFSSTFLVSQNLTFSKVHSFKQPSLSTEMPIIATQSALTYYRTISHVLQNITTSAWVTDNFVVLPFWPTDHPNEPMGPFLGVDNQVWTAETLVFATELECEPIYTKSVSLSPGPIDGNSSNLGYQPLINFETASGCSASISVSNTTAALGFAAWFAPDQPFLDSYFTGCTGDDILFFTTASVVSDVSGNVITNPNYKIQGQLCSAGYYVADTTVTVSPRNGESIISVDEEEYRRKRRVLPPTVVAASSIQSLFLNDTLWLEHFFNQGDVLIVGPAALLAARHEFSTQHLMQDDAILSAAVKLKQRFLGEALREAFDAVMASHQSENEVSGTVQSTRRRIIAVPAVAILLEAVLAIELVLLLVILAASRLKRRPLGISIDPSTSVAIAQFLSRDKDTLRQLQAMGINHPSDLLNAIGRRWNHLEDNALQLLGAGPIHEREFARLVKKLGKRGNLPAVLNILMLVCLSSLIVAILVAICVLFGFAETKGLYQTAFVYQLNFKVGKMQLDAINPASVLTTLLGVCLSLWWGAVDSDLRRVQPYLALAEKSVKGHDGANLTYQSSYMLWTAYRAIKRRHWILALVSTGALFAEILTIAMSAMWSRQESVNVASSALPVSLGVRQAPLLRVGHINTNDYFSSSYGGETLSELFANQTTSWMYGASIQLTLNGSQPAWSLDGWSFAPIDLSSLHTRKIQSVGQPSTLNSTETTASSATLVEVATTGVHARLECSPYDSLRNLSSWLTMHDLTNGTYWNTSANSAALETGYELGSLDCYSDSDGIVRGQLCGTAGDMNITTTFFGQAPQLSCCENRTNDNYGNAVIGYWSANGLYFGSLLTSFTYKYPFNLTVKWIQGIPHEGYQTNTTTIPELEPLLRGPSRHLIWQEAPQMTALSCQPVIETADIRLTIDIGSNQVQNYTILSDPVPDATAWTDVFLEHIPEDYEQNGSNWYPVNVTVSYGAYFLAALISAVDTTLLTATARAGLPDFENPKSQTFNIRGPGLNMDYMSYSMYALAGSDNNALLNATTMERTAQQTFSTFFQHYASTSVSSTDGGWVFGKIGERLPPDLTDASPDNSSALARNQTAAVTIALVKQPIEVLQISKVAAGIAIFVLIWLGSTTVALGYISRSYSDKFRWKADNIADIAVMLIGSTRLLAMLEEKGIRYMKDSNKATAKLADFVPDGSTTKRWGIEVDKTAIHSTTSSNHPVPQTPHFSSPSAPVAALSRPEELDVRASTPMIAAASSLPIADQPDAVQHSRPSQSTYLIPRKPIPGAPQSLQPLSVNGARSQRPHPSSPSGAQYRPQLPPVQTGFTSTPFADSLPNFQLFSGQDSTYARLAGDDSPASAVSDEREAFLSQDDPRSFERYGESIRLEQMPERSGRRIKDHQR